MFATGDCKAPKIDNAIMDTSTDVFSHLSELSVICGDETIVLKCEHGSWDQTLAFCPAGKQLSNFNLNSLFSHNDYHSVLYHS